MAIAVIMATTPMAREVDTPTVEDVAAMLITAETEEATLHNIIHQARDLTV